MAVALSLLVGYAVYWIVVYPTTTFAVFCCGALYALMPEGDGRGGRAAALVLGAAAQALGNMAAAVAGIVVLKALGREAHAPYLVLLYAANVLLGAYKVLPGGPGEGAAELSRARRCVMLAGGLVGLAGGLGLGMLIGWC